MTGRALCDLQGQHVDVLGIPEVGLLGTGYVVNVRGGALRLAARVDGPVELVIDLETIMLVQRVKDKRALQVQEGGRVHQLRQPAPTY